MHGEIQPPGCAGEGVLEFRSWRVARKTFVSVLGNEAEITGARETYLCADGHACSYLSPVSGCVQRDMLEGS